MNLLILNKDKLVSKITGIDFYQVNDGLGHLINTSLHFSEIDSMALPISNLVHFGKDIRESNYLANYRGGLN